MKKFTNRLRVFTAVVTLLGLQVVGATAAHADITNYHCDNGSGDDVTIDPLDAGVDLGVFNSGGGTMWAPAVCVGNAGYGLNVGVDGDGDVVVRVVNCPGDRTCSTIVGI